MGYLPSAWGSRGCVAFLFTPLDWAANFIPFDVGNACAEREGLTERDQHKNSCFVTPAGDMRKSQIPVGGIRTSRAD